MKAALSLPLDILIGVSFIFAGLSHEKNLHKMRVLTFMSMGEAKSEVSFDDLSKELNISFEEIEEFVIEGQ